MDEIQDPAEPTTIVPRHLESDLLEATAQRPLNRKERKCASKRILEALSIMHEDGYVHTDVKLDSILVNFKKDRGTAKSTGPKVISLLYDGDFNISRLNNVGYGDENYYLEVLKALFRYFGPFPSKIREILDDVTLTNILRDKDFVVKMMQMDWRDRPTAGKLLQDGWFRTDRAASQ
ncbi:hypothetical protein F5B18DRAFT_650051 [Nemania serpens]|nr:hypothetical protein F5B18DRAFT_650051 [Nemania serpens]